MFSPKKGNIVARRYIWLRHGNGFFFLLQEKRRNVIVDTFPNLEYEDGQIEGLLYLFCRIIPFFSEASEHTYMGNFMFLSGPLRRKQRRRVFALYSEDQEGKMEGREPMQMYA